jgi:hypothetical protein
MISRKILDHGSFKDFSYGCVQTIHPSRWAISGEAGRFTDPLYSPGGDLISVYNTLITDAAVFYSRLTKWDEHFDGLPVHAIQSQIYFRLAFEPEDAALAGPCGR